MSNGVLAGGSDWEVTGTGAAAADWRWAWRWSWAFVLFVLLAGLGTAGAEFYGLSPVYQAEAVVRFRDVQRTQGGAAPQGPFALLRQSPPSLDEYARWAESPDFLGKAAKEAGVSPAALESAVRVRPLRNTGTLVISARAGRPEEAARMANALAEVLAAEARARDGARSRDYVRALEAQAQAVLERARKVREELARGGDPSIPAEAYVQSRLAELRQARLDLQNSQATLSSLRAELRSLQAAGASPEVVRDRQAKVAAKEAEIAARTRAVEALEKELQPLLDSLREVQARQAREAEARVLEGVAADLYRQLSQAEVALKGGVVPAAEVLSRAVPPREPFRPQPLRDGAAAAVLAAGATAVFISAVQGYRQRRAARGLGSAAG